MLWQTVMITSDLLSSLDNTQSRCGCLLAAAFVFLVFQKTHLQVFLPQFLRYTPSQQEAP